MSEFDRLESELIRAGRSLAIAPPPDDLAERVLTRIADRPVPAGTRGAGGPGWWRWLRARRRRLVAAIVAAVIIASTLTPPVRAAVVEWLRIGGVVVRTVPPPAASATPAAPTAGQPTGLRQARASVDFPFGVPTRLGEPDRVTVSADRRVVGMDWSVNGRPVHLDQFDGTMSWAFVKQNWTKVTPTDVDGRDAVWIADPHEIVYVDRDGIERPETARIAGPALVWEATIDGRSITVRLEGVAELSTARAIGESLS